MADAVPDDPSRVLVTGEIVDEQGRPQPNVPAEIVAHFENLPVRSDAQGRVAMRFPGAWIEEGLVLCRAGALLGMADLDDSDQDGLPEPFRMVLKPKRVVSVTVKAADGSGVPQARVIAYHGNSDVATALTDSAGELRLDLPADARITKIVAFKSGAGFDYRTVPHDGLQKPIGSLEPLPEPVTFTLGGVLESRTVVVTDTSDMPVPGIRVTLAEVLKPERGERILLGESRWLNGVTDAKGEVRFDALPSDTRCQIRFGFVSDRWHTPYRIATYPRRPRSHD